MNRKRKLVLVLVCAVGLAPCVDALDLEDCSSEFGAPARCGVLEVPEDRERPGARRIGIRIVVLSSSAAEPGAPVLMLPGGPGQAAADLAPLALQVYPGVLEARDVVLVGQRGTRDSHALHCLEGVAADPSLTFGALWPREEIRRCWEKTRATADPSRYATADYVADIADALDRLGHDEVLLWGGSGGTRTAQAFLRAHPDRVVAMALDGVTAIDYAMPLPFSGFAERAWQRVVADCDAQVGCARAYPELDANLDRLFALTESSGAEAEIRTRGGETVRVRVSPGDLAYALRGLLYNAAAIPRLPHEVDRAAGAGDLSFFAQSLYERSAGLLSGVVAVGLHLSTYCVEDVPRIEGFDVVAETRDTFIGSYLVDEYRAACAVWPVTPAPASWYRGFRSEVPTLLLSGYYDPSTPDVAAEEVGRSLPNHRHLVVRDAGHGAGFTCARSAVEGFLRTGSLEGIADPCPGAPPTFVVEATSRGRDSAAANPQDEPSRSITRVTGDLYRATQNAHHTVFLVTSAGIVLADPIGRDFATWLKAELARRFAVPVRYVLYSHHHQDHASGGAVFADTAELVGHERMVEHLTARRDDDAYANVRPPDRTYSDELTVELGGKRVRMIHALPSHSDDSSIIHFPDERAVFAVDFVNVRRLPYRTMGTGPIQRWIEANRDMQERVDYDIVAPGHGPVGEKADVDASIRYMEDLLAAVGEGMAAGQSLEQLQASVLMEEYADWAQYDAWRAENVEAAYRSLREK